VYYAESVLNNLLFLKGLVRGGVCDNDSVCEWFMMKIMFVDG